MHVLLKAFDALNARADTLLLAAIHSENEAIFIVKVGIVSMISSMVIGVVAITAHYSTRRRKYGL